MGSLAKEGFRKKFSVFFHGESCHPLTIPVPLSGVSDLGGGRNLGNKIS